jgi:hypothetical protein
MNTPGGNPERDIRGIYPNMTVEDLVEAQVIDSSDQEKYQGTYQVSRSEELLAWMSLMSAIRNLQTSRHYQ